MIAIRENSTVYNSEDIIAFYKAAIPVAEKAGWIRVGNGGDFWNKITTVDVHYMRDRRVGFPYARAFWPHYEVLRIRDPQKISEETYEYIAMRLDDSVLPDRFYRSLFDALVEREDHVTKLRYGYEEGDELERLLVGLGLKIRRNHTPTMTKKEVRLANARLDMKIKADKARTVYERNFWLARYHTRRALEGAKKVAELNEKCEKIGHPPIEVYYSTRELTVHLRDFSDALDWINLPLKPRENQ